MQEEIVCMTDHSWMDTLVQNREGHKNLKRYSDTLKVHIQGNTKDTNAIVQREVTNSIVSELSENIAVAKEKIKYDYNAFNEEDIRLSKLTQREQDVLQARVHINKFSEIDKLLNLQPASSFKAYETGIKKIEKFKKLKSAGQEESNLLSDQQCRIYELMNQGLSDEVIAEKLDINVLSIPQQRLRINSKMNIESNLIDGVKLSKQQILIFEHMKQGKKTKEIAELLQTSEGNVRKQKAIINKKCYQK